MRSEKHQLSAVTIGKIVEFKRAGLVQLNLPLQTQMIDALA